MTRYQQILFWIARLLLGATFTFSGFVKAIDPWGSAIKFEEYFRSFHLDLLIPLSMLAGILLAAFEFVVGAGLLLGSSWRKNTFWALLIMLVMTPLTLYLAIANPVSDCGCFGDAVKLTNWETFGKNIVLLAAAIGLFRCKKPLFSFYSRDFQWFPGLLIFFFSLLLSWVSLKHLPLIDFLPYKVGSYLPDKMAIPDDAVPDEYETTFIYSRGGVQKEFTVENYPAGDSTWQFVDSKYRLVKKGYTPPIHDFVILDDNGVDLVPSILQDSAYTFLVVMADLAKSDDSHIDKINDLYDYTLEEGLNFYGVTASGKEKILEWRDNTGAEYPIFTSDGTNLKTIIRANPGVVLLKGGVVEAKWNAADLPQERMMAQLLENPDLIRERESLYDKVVGFLCASFVILLIILLILERSFRVLFNRYKIFHEVRQLVDKEDPEDEVNTPALNSKQDNGHENKNCSRKLEDE